MNTQDNNIQFMNFNSIIPQSVNDMQVIDKKSTRDFVLWGADNRLPNTIYDTYMTCSDLQTLVNRQIDYVIGNDMMITKDDRLLTDNDSIEYVINSCIADYTLFGGFAVEGIRNSLGNLVRLNYVNVMSVRVDETLTTAFISNKWGSWQGKNMITLPLYDKNEIQPHFIFYYRGSTNRAINPTPTWYAAMKSAMVLNESRNYNLNNIINNFSSNVVIALNGTSIKTRELEEIKNGITMGYTGSNNAGKTMVINNTNAEGKVEITRLDSDKAADIYRNVQESSQNDLYTAFAMNPILIGVNVQTGFSKTEFAAAYALYKSTIIAPIRRQIEREFGKLGVGIKFFDLKIDWGEE